MAFFGRSVPRWLQHAAFVVLLIVLVLAQFGHLPWYYFTGMDTLPHLHSSIATSWSQFIQVLTSPVKHRVIPETKLYRPASDLSYILNYLLGGFEPRVYWVTNLILHGGVCVGVYALVLAWMPGACRLAGASAVLFSLNPIMADTLPVMNYRQELVATVFMVWGLVAFHHACGGKKVRLGWGILAGILFLLAMGGKEFGVLFLPVAVLQLWLLGAGAPAKGWSRMKSVGRRCLPYGLLLVTYLAWWFYVTGGRALLGGGRGVRPALLEGGREGFLDRLLDPQAWMPGKVLTRLLQPVLDPIGQAVSWSRLSKGYFAVEPSLHWQAVAVGGSILVLFWSWRLYYRRPAGVGEEPLRPSTGFGWASRGVLIASVLLVLGYPWVSAVIQPVVRQAYLGEGHRWLAGFMDSRDVFPLIHYQKRARDFLLWFSSLGVILGATGLLGESKPRRWFRYPGGRTDYRVVGVGLLSGIWIAFVVVFYRMTFVRGWNNLYVAVVPLSVLLAVVARLTGRGILQAVRQWREEKVRPGLLAGGQTLGFMLAGLFVVGIVRLSPLVNNYDAWDEIQRLNRLHLEQLEWVLERVPSGSTVEILGRPHWVDEGTRDREYPHIEGYFTSLLHYPVWIRRTFPGRDYHLRRQTRKRIQSGYDGYSVWIEIEPLGSHYFRLKARWAGPRRETG